MIRITFEENQNGEIICDSPERELDFVMNREAFEHRERRFYQGALLFDGYSVWFEEKGDYFRRAGEFTISFLVAPIGYAGQGDGLFSLFDREKKEGFYVQIKKQGKVEVGFGNGRELFIFGSINRDAVKGAFNIITVVFRQSAGWCDLYVNGVFSNRKQFPRHMQIRWPEGEAFLGRYADNGGCGKQAAEGCFYGFMKEVLLHKRALSDGEMRELHRKYPVEAVTESMLPDRRVYEGDVQRPAYHLIAPGKWMNEPHAPFYFKGYYHIFYQANPHAPTWNHIQWGHMVSRDMVRWEDMPPALEPGEVHLDPDGCWSGSALVDKEGVPRIFYTAGNNNRFPNQFVAMATADVGKGDKLSVWKKHDTPVVEQTKGWMGEFRDPFVWLEGDTYFMLVGTGDENNGGGNAVLYSGEDLLCWRCHGFILDYDYEKNQELGHVWELPVLLPLREESGEIACHILLVCACQIEGQEVVENYGFLGSWDPAERRFRKFHERALLIDLGNGTFTGPSGLVTPDLRSVVFTIAQGKRGGKETFLSGWAHNGGLPLEMSVCGKELRIRPVREICGLRGRKLLGLENISLEEAKEQLAKFSGNRLWLKICADARALSLEVSGGGTIRRIYYDADSRRFGALDEKGEEIGKYRGIIDAVDIGQEPVAMELFLDHSMVEVYLNERKAITLRNYIEGKERRLRVEGEVRTVRVLELWEMGSAWEEREADCEEEK